MNTIWKSYIHIVLGGLSVVLIIGGLLWFFVIKQSPESALAIVGGLVTLFGWFQTREDKKEQAQDKAEIISAIRAKKHKIPVEVNGYISDKHREADKRLVRKLWQYINIAVIEEVDFGINNRNLEWKYYLDHINYYQHLRHRRENQLINNKLEKAFKEFDTVLQKLVDQLSKHSDVVRIGSREVIIPHYKLPEVKPGHYFPSDKVRVEQYRQHDIDVELAQELLNQHGDLTMSIKTNLPEADDIFWSPNATK